MSRGEKKSKGYTVFKQRSDICVVGKVQGVAQPSHNLCPCCCAAARELNEGGREERVKEGGWQRMSGRKRARRRGKLQHVIPSPDIFIKGVGRLQVDGAGRDVRNDLRARNDAYTRG